ncbi:MAG: GTPase ObgE [Blautia massiliensis (ex Durand et al. 2017)]
MATSNFIDTATIWLHAGKGGDGAVTFHREKYVAAGGPDGGDGGRGGDIIFVADDNLSTLMDFRYKRKYTAPDGENGRAKRQSGADADDLVIRVPRGTVLKEAESGLVIADLSGSEPVVVARGGRGGWGNSHFATPTRQIPKFAKPGLPGEDLHVQLELKVIADVGLIGFPNVGKSTLISILSAARPKIANYHFTTLTPVLGVVRVGPEQSFVCADIPGLIEGAAEGVGLGHDFLRHVERCRLLLHVVDVSGCEGRDPKQDFEQINHELAGFSAELAQRPQIVLGNKCDIATEEQVAEFRAYVEGKGLTFLPISAATRQGVDGLPALVYSRLQDLPPIKVYAPEYKRPDKSAEPTRPFTVTRTGDHEFTVDAPWLERILAGTNVEDYESLQYFQTQLGDSGILDALVAQGVEEEDTIKIGEYEFDYLY